MFEQIREHREQERQAIKAGEICPHGRGLGISSFDVFFCGDCEWEQIESEIEAAQQDLEDYLEAVDTGEILTYDVNPPPFAEDTPF